MQCSNNIITVQASKIFQDQAVEKTITPSLSTHPVFGQGYARTGLQAMNKINPFILRTLQT
ncbi:hypothetical protein [Nonlabens xiamenensis]|uniref:hypothetical protein n=1 Tax=Nonlabens xiamenensis TaxID=2341043 RepID=UPI000F60D8F4|nr:hypothetical protein [Nonlabens xiamenensis]